MFIENYLNLSEFFYKLQHKLPNTVLRNIYFAFIYPHLIYGIELYGNTFHTYLDKLLKLNNMKDFRGDRGGRGRLLTADFRFLT